jgi:hypothetical protein
MGEGIITFDFIWDSWKTQTYSEDFEGLLEKYLNIKNDIFVGTDVDIKKQGIPSWLSKILVAIEIGILKNPEKFSFYKNYWENLLNIKWKVSIEDRWVVWV